MKIIGLTGGIGSGKSTVAGLLAELGAVIIDADKIGHEVLSSDSETREKVVSAFGKRILNPDGSVDRSKLGRIVFADRKALSHLNSIIHPRIHLIVKARIEQYKKHGAKVVVIDAPLLIEAGWAAMVDAVWVVTATEASILNRLENTGLSRDESMARIRSQLTEGERIKMADIIIDNNCSLNELKLKMNELWQRL